MIDVIDRWQRRLRAQTATHHATEFEALQAEIDALSAQWTPPDEFDRLVAEVDYLEEQVANARHRLARDTEARQIAQRARKAATEALFLKAGARLARCQAAADLEVVERSGEVLKTNLGARISYREVAHLLTATSEPARRRARIAARLAQVQDRQAERPALSAEVDALEARLAELQARCQARRATLSGQHSVRPAVLDAIVAMEGNALARFTNEFLIPMAQRARAEADWQLPASVLDDDHG